MGARLKFIWPARLAIAEGAAQVRLDEAGVLQICPVEVRVIRIRVVERGTARLMSPRTVGLLGAVGSLHCSEAVAQRRRTGTWL